VDISLAKKKGALPGAKTKKKKKTKARKDDAPNSQPARGKKGEKGCCNNWPEKKLTEARNQGNFQEKKTVLLKKEKNVEKGGRFSAESEGCSSGFQPSQVM